LKVERESQFNRTGDIKFQSSNNNDEFLVGRICIHFYVFKL